MPFRVSKFKIGYSTGKPTGQESDLRVGNRIRSKDYITLIHYERHPLKLYYTSQIASMTVRLLDFIGYTASL